MYCSAIVTSENARKTFVYIGSICDFFYMNEKFVNEMSVSICTRNNRFSFFFAVTMVEHNEGIIDTRN